MKNIIIVVDMQKGFGRHEQTKILTHKIEELLDKKIFDIVIATRFLNNSNSIYEKLFTWKHLESEEERAIAPGIQKHVNYIEDKYIYNCVNASFIQRLCQLNDGIYPEKVFVVGADTDCCVLTIATALFEYNIRPVVLTYYCASNGGLDSHMAGIKCMERLIGINQIISKQIIDKSDIKNI